MKEQFTAPYFRLLAPIPHTPGRVTLYWFRHWARWDTGRIRAYGYEKMPWVCPDRA